MGRQPAPHCLVVLAFPQRRSYLGKGTEIEHLLIRQVKVLGASLREKLNIASPESLQHSEHLPRRKVDDIQWAARYLRVCRGPVRRLYLQGAWL